MAFFKYKTRAMSTPQGLPRVYFSCHPRDFDMFFEAVSDEILSKQNCAVYYDCEPEAPFDEELFFADLSRMQLFVMPVTTMLLTTQNRALNVEFAFAIKHHIPVLPLMQEGGLEALFNKKCGDLQFLDKNTHDKTAIGYNEKLEKYLASVLVGDELAAKVRGAFDAYVFLSYRKKDRKYAQELMRLIHKNDFCRDIAIWYDEFLTPGENFNNAISDALKKSGLFALVVTPNLVNEENYVMTTEYPMAIEYGKIILPAELVSTDKRKLAEKYSGIPACTDAYNENELTASLLKSVQAMAIKENDKNPEHNFFIGLAYLAGIDVEVDKARALRLITSSAEAGLCEATEKLVQMYRNGEGVERNYETAIRWQKKLAEQLEQAFEENKDNDNAYALFLALARLVDYITELHLFGEAKSVCKKILTFCLANSAALEDDYQYVLSAVYGRLGKISEAEGNLQQAKEYYLKEMEICRQLAVKLNTVQAHRDLAVSYNNLGAIAKSEGDWRQAREYYLIDLKICCQLEEEARAEDDREGLSAAYNSLGTVEEADGNLHKAKEYYMKAFEINKRLAEETKSAEHLRLLSGAYQYLGRIARKENDFQTAEEYGLKLLELSQRIFEEAGTVESLENLSVSHQELGTVMYEKGDLQLAAEHFKSALKICKQLAEKTQTVQDRRGLALGYNSLGDILKDSGDLNQAKKHYLKALEISEQLAKETRTVQEQRALAVSYGNIGDIAKAGQDFQQAEAYYLKSLEICKQLAGKTENVPALKDLFVIYIKLGDLADSKGDLQQAEAYCLKALEISEQLAEKTQSIQADMELPVVYNKLAVIADAAKNLPSAKKYCLKLLEIREKLARQIKTTDALEDLTASYQSLGNLAQAEDDLHQAEEYYLKALEIRIHIAEKDKSTNALRALSISYEKLGVIAQTGGGLQQARGYYEKSMEIRKQLAQAAKTMQSYDDLAISFFKIGFLEPYDVQMLRQAQDIWRDLSEQNPENGVFAQRRDMVTELLSILTAQ